jgi:hypothetical protein
MSGDEINSVFAPGKCYSFDVRGSLYTLNHASHHALSPIPSYDALAQVALSLGSKRGIHESIFFIVCEPTLIVKFIIWPFQLCVRYDFCAIVRTDALPPEILFVLLR